MANIHGIWFIIIGFIVSIISYFNKDVRAFLYIGIIFILYGIIKLLIQFLKQPKKKHYKHPHHHSHQHHQNHNSPQTTTPNPQQQQQNQPKNQQAFFCRNCGKRIAFHDNFCSHCGIRLR